MYVTYSNVSHNHIIVGYGLARNLLNIVLSIFVGNKPWQHCLAHLYTGGRENGIWYNVLIKISCESCSAIIACVSISVSNSTNVVVTRLDVSTVGQPLMLQCAMSTPTGISSTVDIAWRRDGVEVEYIENISSNFSSPEVVVYTNIYTIPLLGTYDDNIVYECEVVINSSPILKVSDSIIINVTGMCPLTCYSNYFTVMYFHSSSTSC